MAVEAHFTNENLMNMEKPNCRRPSLGSVFPVAVFIATLQTQLLLCAAVEPDGLRLGDAARPIAYSVELIVLPDQDKFSGTIQIDLRLSRRTPTLWLHSSRLEISGATIEQRGKTEPLGWKIGSEDRLGFDLPSNLRAGRARLVINYTGSISDTDASGLFRRQDAGQWYAATQMEPIGARKVFPCFDEPAFKVPWTISLHARQEHTAISNGRALSESPGLNGMKRVSFATTEPIPSYLVAFAVGPFDCLDLGLAGRKPTFMRIYTARGRTNEAAYAAAALPGLLTLCEDYFRSPYPYSKLDHVVMPQFFGGMENAGMIIYGDSFVLAPPGRETRSFKSFCADICAHEIAHHWFGNLVTMPWWDDIWLNESFATWITPAIVDQWDPQLGLHLEQMHWTWKAAVADSQASSRGVRRPVASAAEIQTVFDDIIYAKGAAVLESFEAWLGKEQFRKVIVSYLSRHAWGVRC
jgi:cytosol alanyl aminopeptidase